MAARRENELESQTQVIAQACLCSWAPWRTCDAATGGVAPSRLSHTVRAAATGCAPAACSSGATAAQTLSSVCAYVNALRCEGVVFAYVLACNPL